MFPLAKRVISDWSSRHEPKSNLPGVLIMFGGWEYFPQYVGNPNIYQASKSNCFIVARAIRAHEALFNVQIHLLRNFLEITSTILVGQYTPIFHTVHVIIIISRDIFRWTFLAIYTIPLLQNMIQLKSLLQNKLCSNCWFKKHQRTLFRCFRYRIGITRFLTLFYH